MAGQTACRAIVVCNLPRFWAYIRAMIGLSKRIRSSFATNQKRCSSTRWRFRAVRGNFIAPLAHPNSKKKTTNLLRQKKGIKGAVFKSFIFLLTGQKEICFIIVLTGGERGSENDISNSACAFPDFVGLNITSSCTNENAAISPLESCTQKKQIRQNTKNLVLLTKRSFR